MKIVEIMTHMSVQFGVRKHEFRHFSPKSKKFPGLEMRLIPHLGVEVKNEEDCVIVPLVNITAIRVEQGQDNKVAAPSAAEAEVLGLDEPDVEELEEQEATESKPSTKIRRTKK